MSKGTRGADVVAFLRDYARERINSRLFDARRCIAPYVVLDFGRQGLLGLGVPQTWGGLGLSWCERIAVVQQLAAIDLTLTMFVGIHNELGIGPILNFGLPGLKERLIPSLARGQMLGGLAITEDGAGANPRGLSGTVEPSSNGGWRLNAEKIWVGNGSWAGVLNVFARWTEGRQSRILGFAVATDAPGVRMGPEAMTMGMRGIVQSRVHFSNVELEADRLLGDSAHDMLVAESSFRMARFGVAIAATGAMKRCLQLLLRYAGHRQIATGALAGHPLFRATLGDTHAAVQVLDALTLLMGTELDAERTLPAELFFVCKALGPEYLFEAADALMQWLGGRGYVEANEAPQLLRDARLLRIFEGPTETMRSHIGSLWRHHEDLRAFLGSRSPNTLIAQRISAVADELWAAARHPSLSVGQYTAARYCAIGEVVADGVAWWTAATLCSDESTHEWAKRRFEATSQRVLQTLTRPVLPTADLARTVAVDIGDVWQQLPGEDWLIDPLLRSET